MNALHEKTVLITGANAGIGKECKRNGIDMPETCGQSGLNIPFSWRAWGRYRR